MDRRRYLAVSSALLAGALAGCTAPAASQADVSASAPSTPALQPDVDSDTLDELVTGTNTFALDLFDELRTAAESENLLVSPISATIALAMTYAGSSGTTREQMRASLGYTVADHQLHAAFNELQRTLSGRDDDLDGEDLPSDYDEGDDPVPFQLSLVNAIWGQAGFPFRDEYRTTLENHYGGGLNQVDFVENPDGVREAINAWIADQTDDRIEALLPADSITSETVLVLTNAISFMANWRHPFDEDQTEPAEFTALDGSTSTVQMMSQDVQVPAATVDGAQAVELPYVGGTTGMLIVVPPAGEFAAYERSFDGEQLGRIVDALEPQRGYVNLPRFEFDSSCKLEQALEALGMTDAFDPDAADFSRMADLSETGGNLFVDQVYHDTSISVDEQGTEAAVATGSVVNLVSLPPTVLNANRPFLFVIRDRPTGTVLFTGHVVDAGAAQE
ncbi:serine protease inhibitor-like protein [Halolamina pelagica]|uniref:Serine protease inhibitor-like protein n=1 Tax=Halolamina pelagica TaxID=699431 RepID=A0A0P7FRP0_9EURY|nr:serpin family protein [Halolamina pelagica]KPN29237.1 serine protease inhibitor-like protein [Halolamina pelagica]